MEHQAKKQVYFGVLWDNFIWLKNKGGETNYSS